MSFPIIQDIIDCKVCTGTMQTQSATLSLHGWTAGLGVASCGHSAFEQASWWA